MIKNLYRYMIAAAAITLSACSNEEESFNSYASDPNAVHINATIGPSTRVTSTAAAPAWVSGDKIYVSVTSGNSESHAVYQYGKSNESSESAFAPVASYYLVWKDSGNNFKAYYPYGETTTSYESFTLPSDQSDTDKIGKADWMTATAENVAKSENAAITLAFNHKLALVKFNVTTVQNQYESTPSLSNISLQLPGTLTDNSVTATSPITPFYADIKTIYAIVPPGTYSCGAELIKFTVNGTDNLTVNTKAEYTLKAGHSYSFDLTVGKKVVTIGTVSVNEWTQNDKWTVDNADDDAVIDVTRLTTEDAIKAAIESAVSGKDSGIKLTFKGSETKSTFRNALKEYFGLGASKNFSDYTKVARIDLTGVTFVDKILGDTFKSNESLIEVLLPDKCPNGIASTTFDDCKNLISVKLPNNLTTIESNLFRNCNSLQNIDLPSEVTSIGSNAFQNCKSLTFIICRATTPPTLGENAFINISNCILYVPKGYKDAYLNSKDITSDDGTKTTSYGWTNWFNEDNIVELSE